MRTDWRLFNVFQKRQSQTDFRNEIAFWFLCRQLARLIQHIFNKYTVSRFRIVDEDVCHRADQLAVLDDRAARHECGQVRTTNFVSFFIVSTAIFISSSVGNLSGSVFTISNALYFDPA